MKYIKMKNINIYLLALLVICLFTACEEEFFPEISNQPLDLVVEGYIEAGEGAAPPYVLLTRSVSFFSEVDADGFDDFFVHDAVVTISDGDNEVILSELCLNDLNEEQREQAADLFGLEADNLELNFCVYLDLTFGIMGEIGKTYHLNIEAENKTMTSSTTIPEHIPLDSIAFVEAPGTAADTLRQLQAFIDDPAGIDNYYRIFTGDENGVQPSFNSVVNDAFFDGLNFEFIIPKATPRNAEVDPATAGLFTVGDTAVVKWCTIDESHYQFWNTLEYNAANQGPFSSYTRVDSNIEGGIGVWGGYSVSYYSLPVE